MQLHIGGKQVKDGWRLMNIQPGPGVDYVGDISNLEQFGDDSCEKVYASHVLEHIPQQKVLPCLTGIRRILKPGGLFFVSVPDWDILCHLFINPTANLGAKWHAVQMMMGGQVDQYDYHYVGFNQALLYDFLRQVGFSNAERVESFNYFEDNSSYRPYGFPISLNIIATK